MRAWLTARMPPQLWSVYGVEGPARRLLDGGRTRTQLLPALGDDVDMENDRTEKKSRSLSTQRATPPLLDAFNAVCCCLLNEADGGQGDLLVAVRERVCSQGGDS